MKIANFNKSVKLYICVNKNGSVGIHMIEPIRDEERGLWISKMPFCNSLAYMQFTNLIEKSSMTWNNDPEPVEFNI